MAQAADPTEGDLRQALTVRWRSLSAGLRRRANLRRLLPAGGRLALLVPQYASLYGPYDQALQHRRRYDREELVQKVTAAGFQAG